MSIVQDLIDQEVKSYTKRVNFLHVNEFRITSILGAFTRANIELTDISSDGHCLNISLHGNREVLNKSFGILRNHDLIPDCRPEERSTTYSAWFEEEHAEDREGKGFPLVVWFYFSSTTCRRVKTGSKTVTVDIYDTVCDDE
jgi:hypothetical protein